MKRNRYAMAASLVSAVSALQGGCGQKSYSELAERPEEKAAAAPSVKDESLISLNAQFPYETLTKALSASLPADIPIQGRQRVCVDVEVQVQKTIEDKIGGDVGKAFGAVARIVTKVVTVGQTQNLCSDIDYSASIRREGDVAVSQNGDTLRFSVPVRADGRAGFAGDLAKVLSLSRKNFRGALTATVDIRMDIDENWCPTVQATPDFSWREKAQLEVAGKFWIDIDSQAGDAIKKAMNEAAQKIPNLVTCDQIKQLVQPIWHEYTVPLPSLAGHASTVNLVPQRVGFSGLGFTPTGAQLALMLSAQSYVHVSPASAQGSPATSAASAKPTALTLPKLERIPAQQNKLKLSVPITVSYATLQALANAAIVDKPFEGATDGTKASVTAKEIKVYPAGERLVVGVRFESKISKPKSLAPKGWVYLLAKPSFNAETQTLSLTEIDFSRIIDNDLWNALSFLFQNQLRAEIEKAVRVDLRPTIADARAVLRRELAAAGAKEGINIDLKDDFLGLRQVALADAGPRIVVGFEGGANIVVLNRPIR